MAIFKNSAPAATGIFLAVAAVSSANAAAPRLVATNLPGVMAYAAPPAGFDALTASDDDLASYGFPARPAAFGDGRAIRGWERLAHAARHWVAPVLRQTHMQAGPVRMRSMVANAGSAAGGNATSKNWSGEVILNHANGLAPGAFKSVVGWFNVPTANQPFGTCDGTWDQLYTWVGIDGWSSSQVFQAGTESDAYCGIYGNYIPNYDAWYEWFPDYSTQITSLIIYPGDVVGVWMVANSPTTGTAFIVDGTSGNYAIISLTAPPGITLKGDSAEWIEERPSSYGVPTHLTNYVEAWISDEGATELGMTPNYNAGALPAGGSMVLVNMLDDASQPISNATALGGNATEFHTVGSAY